MNTTSAATLLVSIALLLGAAPGLAQDPTRLVVIDPGHGGVDPGARGASGILEKEVALRVAHELASALRASPGVVVRLTREDDTLIPLQERTRLANRWRADLGPGTPALFVSIHANAHERSSARGIETYFLSDALTEDARRVAELENSAVRFEDGGPSDPLAVILDDLRRNLYLRESSEGAALIQAALADVHPGPDRGVKQARFVVLDGAFMPATLVEIGFITNRQEESLLASHTFGQALATRLAEAILAFFDRTSAADLAVSDR